MRSYRIYKLNRAGHIVAGEWMEADGDTAAREAAHAMCDEVTPTVEVWLGARCVAILPCDDPARQMTGSARSGSAR
jgi:hypothetical protein